MRLTIGFMYLNWNSRVVLIPIKAQRMSRFLMDAGNQGANECRMCKLSVCKQVLDSLLHLSVGIWPYVIKFVCHAFFCKMSSMISVITSLISRPAARTCWGMKLVAVMPGVVLISSMLILSPSVMI